LQKHVILFVKNINIVNKLTGYVSNPKTF